MIRGGKGGGHTRVGLNFEKEVNFLTAISSQKGYTVKDDDIFYNGELVAKSFKKYTLYGYLLSKGINDREILSKKLLPDDAIFVLANNTFFILEIKFQEVAGSTDEKLQTCDFKLKQYKRLLKELNVNVEFIYILNDWFKDPSYKDVLSYIESVGCYYYFNTLPFDKIGLQIPNENNNK